MKGRDGVLTATNFGQALATSWSQIESQGLAKTILSIAGFPLGMIQTAEIA